MPRKLDAWFIRTIASILGLAMAAIPLGQTRAERPVSYELLPASTVAFVRIADTQELVRKLQETSLGRIVQEQQFKPLVTQLYGSATEAFEPVQERVGLTLSELISLPRGELTIAFVVLEDRRPVPVALVDLGEEKANAQTLMESVGRMLQDAGSRKSTETVDGTTITVFDRVGRMRVPLVYLQRESTLVMTGDLEVARQLLAMWSGDESLPSLSDNEAFITVMNRTRGLRDEPPQMQGFVDPIGFIKAAGRDNVGAQAGLALLPVLGLDGLRGVGGSITWATQEYDSLAHVHVLLDSERSGVLAMLALGQGDMTPEDWAPNDVATYRTAYWDVQKTLQELRTLYDSLRGEGALERDIKRRFSDQIGVDMENDVFAALAGRFTFTMWFEPPARPESQSWLVGLRLKDSDQFRGTLDTITEKLAPFLEEQTYGSMKYFQILPGPGRRDGEQRAGDRGRAAPPRPRPCFGILGQYLLVADRPSFLQRAIIAQSDATKRLANELDFKLIASKLRRQSRGNPPGLLMFDRPEESLRLFYEMAANEEIRSRLAGLAENNAFFGALHQSLEDNPLPPFAVIKQYLAPAGAILTQDESGLHYTAFGLRRK